MIIGYIFTGPFIVLAAIALLIAKINERRLQKKFDAQEQRRKAYEQTIATIDRTIWNKVRSLGFLTYYWAEDPKNVYVNYNALIEGRPRNIVIRGNIGPWAGREQTYRTVKVVFNGTQMTTFEYVGEPWVVKLYPNNPTPAPTPRPVEPESAPKTPQNWSSIANDWWLTNEEWLVSEFEKAANDGVDWYLIPEEKLPDRDGWKSVVSELFDNSYDGRRTEEGIEVDPNPHRPGVSEWDDDSAPVENVVIEDDTGADDETEVDSESYDMLLDTESVIPECIVEMEDIPDEPVEV